MNDNIQETVQNVETESHNPETIDFDLSKDFHSVLYCPINDVTIRDLRVRDVFTKFLKIAECGKTITIMDILSSADTYIKNGEPDVNSGDAIYTYNAAEVKDNRFKAKLYKNTIANLYSLFAINNGITLDLDAVGGTVSSAGSKQYLIVPQNKIDKFSKTATRNNIELIKAGTVVATNNIFLSKGNDVVASFDKSVLSSVPPVKVDVGEELFPEFLSGYNAVCSLVLCNCISKNNLIRFGLNGTVSEVFARALGFFSAITYLKTFPIRIVFVDNKDVLVAVSRPNVVDGDYLYLLKLRKDAYDLPDKNHFGQLFYYLGEKKRMGIIKDVLPYGENINRVINRLCNDNLVYDKLTELPENCFGILVTVGRGESVNGIKLGCFKNTL